MTCETFRAELQPGTNDPELLAHLRQCDDCLDYAVGVDADLFFRAVGGEELVPPGGVDAFVSDVMAQVRLHDAEHAIARRPVPMFRRLAIAATLAAAVTGGALVWRHEQAPAPAPAPLVAHAAAVHHAPAVTKPLVETYSSQDATIVEVPTAGANDAKVVMIFDDKLPADL